MTSDINRSAVDVGETAAVEGVNVSLSRETMKGKVQRDLVENQPESNKEKLLHFDKEEGLVEKKNGEETGKNKKQEQFGKSENKEEEKKTTTQKELVEESANGQPASRSNDQNQRTATKNDAGAPRSNAGNQRQPEIETRTENRTSARLDEGNHHQVAALVEHL